MLTLKIWIFIAVMFIGSSMAEEEDATLEIKKFNDELKKNTTEVNNLLTEAKKLSATKKGDHTFASITKANKVIVETYEKWLKTLKNTTLITDSIKKK